MLQRSRRGPREGEEVEVGQEPFWGLCAPSRVPSTLGWLSLPPPSPRSSLPHFLRRVGCSRPVLGHGWAREEALGDPGAGGCPRPARNSAPARLPAPPAPQPHTPESSSRPRASPTPRAPGSPWSRRAARPRGTTRPRRCWATWSGWCRTW
jgi:hypothetical protein